MDVPASPDPIKTLETYMFTVLLAMLISFSIFLNYLNRAYRFQRRVDTIYF